MKSKLNCQKTSSLLYFRFDTLNSDQVKVALDHNQRQMDFSGTAFNYLDDKKPENLTEQEEMRFLNDRLEKLLKIIHARIEEKFRDYRQAFRSIDKDFGGSLEFKEFINSFEEMGIRLKIADFKMIFDALDYDGRG